MKYNELKKLVKVFKIDRYNGSILGKLGLGSYLLADYEGVTYENITRAERKIFEENVDVLTLKALKNDKVSFTKKFNVEGTEIELKAKFKFIRKYNWEDPKIEVIILGERYFRKQNKKEIYQKYYKEFMKKVNQIKRNLENQLEKEWETKFMLNRFRETVAIAKKNGISIKQLLDACETFVEYKRVGKQALVDYGFKGLENLGVYETSDDGFGHQNVLSTNINFLKREVELEYGNSSD
jgi:hypothetical protein